MTDQTLGDDTPTAGANPFVKAELPHEPSIVDTILDLDTLLSADVRRPERSARFCTEPQLEADLDDLNARLDALTDAQGNLPTEPDTALGGTSGNAEAVAVAEQIKTLQHAYADAFRTVRVRAMSSDDWAAFQERHRETLAGDPPFTNDMWDDLITRCAVAPTIALEQLTRLRAQLSHTAIDTIAAAAWQVNVGSGVSIPKSLRSSRVLVQSQRAKSSGSRAI